MIAPDPHTADPRYVDPVALAKFYILCSRMGLIAEAVNAFDDPALRERAFYELVRIINPSPAEPEEADLFGVSQPYDTVELARLATWILDKSPTAWRESIQPGESTVDATIRFLTEGDLARGQWLAVKHALMVHGGFSVEQVDGDLAPLIRELATDTPVSAEVEELAAILRTQARDGETATQVALRLLQQLRVDKVDDRGHVVGERAPRLPWVVAPEPGREEQ